MKAPWLIALLSSLILAAYADDAEIEAVKKILNAPRRDWGRWPWQEHAEDLKPFGDRAMALLASLLEASQLGHHAMQTMLVIDAEKAAPLIFASMPKSGGNIQFHAFARFIPRLAEGDKFPLVSVMHDAAVRCLKAGSAGNEAVDELLVIGLTGIDSDFSLLERYYSNQHPTDFWRRKMQNAAEAALARLGHAKYLGTIEAKLAAPIPSPLSWLDAEALEATIFGAGFSQNPRFTPLLVKHLDDPPADIPRSDVSPPSPSAAARVALYQIATHTSSGFGYMAVEYHKLEKWWNENKSKFGK